MKTDNAEERLRWLRDAVADGRIHTVRVSFGGRLGDWRGKRVPAEHFLEHTTSPMGFCDGMIVCDVSCDIIQTTPFSNYDTGYPDLHAIPDLSGLREAAWAPGEAYVFGEACDAHHRPLDVAPRSVLRAVTGRMDAAGISAQVTGTVQGRLMRSPHEAVRFAGGGLSPAEANPMVQELIDGLARSALPFAALTGGPDEGMFAIRLGPEDPATLAEALLVSKSAARELATAHSLTATFMTRSIGSTRPSTLEVRVAFEGLSETPDSERLRRCLTDASGLLQPSLNALRLGPPSLPRWSTTGDRRVLEKAAASAEADPFTTIAVVLSAAMVAAGHGPDPVGAAPRDLIEAGDLVGASAWLQEWLGKPFVENAAPLLRHEGSLAAGHITDLEVDRYWRSG